MGTPFGSKHNPPPGVCSHFMHRLSQLPGSTGAPHLAVGRRVRQASQLIASGSEPALISVPSPRHRSPCPPIFHTCRPTRRAARGWPLSFAGEPRSWFRPPSPDIGTDSAYGSAEVFATGPLGDPYHLPDRASVWRSAVDSSPRFTLGAGWPPLPCAYTVAAARFSISPSKALRARIIRLVHRSPSDPHRRKHPSFAHTMQSQRNFIKTAR